MNSISASPPDLPPFPDGARWVRADFHVHTLKDPGKSREFRSEFVGRENDFAKEWIERLREQNVELAVVTNHNVFDREEYKHLRKLGAKHGILILPGVELGVKEGAGGIHTLIVFDPDGWVFNPSSDDAIQRFLGSQFSSPPDEGARTKDDLASCLELLDDLKHDYFVVFAHVQSDNGLINELQGDNLRHVMERSGERWRNRVLGLQKVKRPDELERRWSASMPMPAFVEGSDPKNIDAVGKSDRGCFIKIGQPSFAAVKFALRDWKQRVRAGVPAPRPGARLHEIVFQGGKLHGQNFHLAAGLTALIGSRGSGKSAVIETLRFALGMDPGLHDQKYKNGLVSAMLGGGGSVCVKGVTAQGQNFEIKRPLGYEPIVWLEGRETRLKPADVLPGCRYFGQKDLGHRHESFEDEFFARLVSTAQPEESAKESDLVAAVKAAVSDWQTTLKAGEKEKEYADEEARLRDQLKVYQDHGVEEQLARLTTFDADKRGLDEFLDRLRSFRDDLGQADTAWGEFAFGWLNLRSELLSAQAAEVEAAQTQFDELQADYESVQRRLNQLVETFERIRLEVLDRERTEQESFAALQREINAPGLDLTEFRNKKARHEQLVKLLNAASNRRQMADHAQYEVKKAGCLLHEFWRDQHVQEKAKLRELASHLPPSIEWKVEFEGRRDTFTEFLKGRLAGTGFRAASIDKLVGTFANGLQLATQPEKVAELLDGTADLAKCREFLETDLAALLTYRVPDHREIRFNGTPIAQLSLGQRATALLQLIMSLPDHQVILLDQPEDDLDNETLFRHVVEPLLERKTRTQFIIATHNANIPVLGDAELVHACNESEAWRYEHQSGSLDSHTTREAIVSIMEGGREAFAQRQKIYTQWTSLR